MTQISPPDHSSPPTPLPRYRGLYGAIAVGLAALGMVVVIGALGGAVIWLLTRNVTVASQLLVRYLWFGLAAGGAAGMCRLATGAESDGLLKKCRRKHKSLGWLGFVAGLLLAGYLTQRMAPADADADSKQPTIGQTLEIAGPTFDGNHFDLTTHRGKVVLVDFWATWCGPCVAELPNVKAAYDKYHGDGLEVVAISLDNERTALADFLEAHPEPWPQIIFPEERQRGFDNPLAKQFSVQAIPYLLIIDREGKVAARNIRGQQIDVAVTAALGLPVPWTSYLAAGAWLLVGWLMVGVLESPVWLLLVGVLGGTAVWCLAEAAARRVFRPSPSRA